MKTVIIFLVFSLFLTVKANEEEYLVPSIGSRLEYSEKNDVIISKQLINGKISYVLTMNGDGELLNYENVTLEYNSFYYETLDIALYEAGWLDRVVDFSYINSRDSKNWHFKATLLDFTKEEEDKITKFIKNNRYSCAGYFGVDYLSTANAESWNDYTYPPRRVVGIVWTDYAFFLPYYENLITLIRSNKEDEAIKLIENGENINTCDGIGRTPLHYAAKYNMCKLISVLVERGADMNALAMGWTPLHEAIAAESHDAVKLLMKLSSIKGAKKLQVKTRYKSSSYFDYMFNVILKVEAMFYGTKAYRLYYPNGLSPLLFM